MPLGVPVEPDVYSTNSGKLASTARALREYLREEAAHESAHAKTTTVHDALREARHARD